MADEDKNIKSPGKLSRLRDWVLGVIAGLLLGVADDVRLAANKTPGKILEITRRATRRLLRIRVFSILKWAFYVALAVAILSATLILFLIFYPNTQIPTYEPVDRTVYLDQGWGPTSDSPLRQLYYYTPQGTSIYDLRYDWFVHLERPWSRRRFADPDHLRSYGFLVDEAPSPANPDQLPVGFAKHFDPDEGEYLLDITCATCHTGQLNITLNQEGNRRVAIRIDGGAAMHAFTAMEIGHFVPTLVGSLAETYLNPFKFRRFARAVLKNNYPEGRDTLKEELGSTLWAFIRQGWNDKSKHLYPVQEGFGRTDAIGRISNRAFAERLDPANYRVADAPVSYPPVWDIWKFNWVQYSASVSQPMARNVGETLGVGAKYSLTDPHGRPLPESERFHTTTRFEDLDRIELALQQLQPPAWPEDLLGKIDCGLAQRGRDLFIERHCVDCHGPDVADDSEKAWQAPGKVGEAYPQWDVHELPILDIGTDPKAALNFVNNRLDLSKTGLTKAYLVGRVGRLFATQKARLEAERDNLRRSGESPDVLRQIEEILSGYDEQVARTADAIDPSSVSIGEGLWYLGLLMRDRYYTEKGFSEQQIDEMNGFGIIDLPEVKPVYKARPLAGMWATPPFLHNGSVPNVYEMLSPAHERSKRFFLGRREYDPKLLGYKTTPQTPGEPGFWFDTSIPGNTNTGHEFRAGYVERTEWTATTPPSYGVIGPELSHEERMAIIEYLKIHRDNPPVSPDYMPLPCGSPPPPVLPPVPDKLNEEPEENLSL